MHTPSISIIIPCYNAEKYMARCLDSVLAQRFTDFEAICVNDGSTDRTLAILHEYAKKDKRIHVIDSENRGVSGARNLGLDAAQGQFIGFVDADDMIEPQMFEFLHKAASENEGCIAICGCLDDAKGLSLQEYVYDCRKVDIHTVFPVAERGPFGISTINKIFPRKLIGTLRFPEGVAANEDYFFFMQVCTRVDGFVYVDAMLYDYIWHSSSTSRSIFSMKRATALKALTGTCSELKKIGTPQADIILPGCLVRLFKTILSIRYSARTAQNLTKAEHETAEEMCRKAFRKYVWDFWMNKAIPVKLKAGLTLFYCLPFAYSKYRKSLDDTL